MESLAIDQCQTFWLPINETNQGERAPLEERRVPKQHVAVQDAQHLPRGIRLPEDVGHRSKGVQQGWRQAPQPSAGILRECWSGAAVCHWLTLPCARVVDLIWFLPKGPSNYLENNPMNAMVIGCHARHLGVPKY